MPDSRCGIERRLDLAQLDANAAHLDLKIGTAEELDIAIIQVPRDVAGAIQAFARAKRIHDEALRSQLRLVQIAVRNSRAADEQLARHPDRHGLQTSIEYVTSDVCNRLADRNGA